MNSESRATHQRLLKRTYERSRERTRGRVRRQWQEELGKLNVENGWFSHPLGPRRCLIFVARSKAGCGTEEKSSKTSLVWKRESSFEESFKGIFFLSFFYAAALSTRSAVFDDDEKLARLRWRVRIAAKRKIQRKREREREHRSPN